MSHSLIVPRHLAEARRAALNDPGVVTEARVAGRMRNSDEWFEAEKARIRQKCGWALDKFHLTLNRLLVAVFIRPEEMQLVGGETLIMPETVRNEDLYQGVAGLVLKLGPRAYENSDVLTWTDEDKCKVGDWVLMRRGDGGGFRVQLNGVDCVLFENEKGIKAVIPRPDVVY